MRDLRAWGFSCGKHRVARLMSAAGLKAAVSVRRLADRPGSATEHAIAPNVLDRQFEATAPNQRWVADFTYIWTEERLAILCRGDGLFLTADRRLVDEHRDDCTAGHPMHSFHGDLASW